MTGESGTVMVPRLVKVPLGELVAACTIYDLLVTTVQTICTSLPDGAIDVMRNAEALLVGSVPGQIFLQVAHPIAIRVGAGDGGIQ